MAKHWIAIVAALGMVIAACGGSRPENSTASEPAGELLVSAAASLTDAFGDVEAAFEAAQPEVDVVLNLGGSSSLREQILEGAPVDIFASANASNMERVVDGGLVYGAPRVFARNVLQVAVPSGNPAGIAGLQDFDREELLIGLCAEAVPCGAFAREALENAEVIAAIDTNEPDVRALLTKIEAGELDAGITYVTDVASTGGSVEGVDITAGFNVVAEYPIASLADAPNAGAAAAFIAFVVSDEGRAILDSHGFGTP